MQGSPIRRIGPRNDTTLWVYSPAGRLVWERDAVGQWTHHAYDIVGREVTTTVLAKSSEADTSTMSYTPVEGDRVVAQSLDALGCVTAQLVNGVVTRRMGYFADGRVRTDSVAVDEANDLWLVSAYEWWPTVELKGVSRTGGLYNEYLYNILFISCQSAKSIILVW